MTIDPKSPNQVIDPKSLDAIPHLRFQADERTVNLASLWDGSEWHAWLPHEGGIIKIQGGETVEGGYFALAPERPTDLYFEFLDFMWKRASWKDVCNWLCSIEDNIVRTATSLAKLDHFSEFIASRPERDRLDYSGFISTEVEYLFGRCRTMFDDLQRIIAALWDRVELSDPVAQKRKKKLPDESFRKALERIKSASQQDAAPYGLPRPVLEAYDGVAAFFYQLRSIRDQLTHQGGRLEPVFMSDSSGAISKGGRLAAIPPKDLHVEVNQNLIALRPVIAHLVISTLQAFNTFLVAFAQCFAFPPSLFPDHKYFFRCAHMNALGAAHRIVLEKSSATPEPAGGST